MQLLAVKLFKVSIKHIWLRTCKLILSRVWLHAQHAVIRVSVFMEGYGPANSEGTHPSRSSICQHPTLPQCICIDTSNRREPNRKVRKSSGGGGVSSRSQRFSLLRQQSCIFNPFLFVTPRPKASSLHFLSLEGLKEWVGDESESIFNHPAWRKHASHKQLLTVSRAVIWWGSAEGRQQHVCHFQTSHETQEQGHREALWFFHNWGVRTAAGLTLMEIQKASLPHCLCPP